MMVINNTINVDSSLLRDVIEGLSKQQKELPSKYFLCWININKIVEKFVQVIDYALPHSVFILRKCHT